MNLPGYDNWKTETPEDEYARKHPDRRQRGVYTVAVTRMIEARVEVEIEAADEEEAREWACADARKIPLEKWTIHEDDCDIIDVDGPPGRDPDRMREDHMDRDRD